MTVIFNKSTRFLQELDAAVPYARELDPEEGSEIGARRPRTRQRRGYSSSLSARVDDVLWADVDAADRSARDASEESGKMTECECRSRSRSSGDCEKSVGVNCRPGRVKDLFDGLCVL